MVCGGKGGLLYTLDERLPLPQPQSNREKIHTERERESEKGGHVNERVDSYTEVYEK